MAIYRLQPSIDCNEFQHAATDPYVNEIVLHCRDDIVQFALNQLQCQQPRDDYQEFLELSLLFLGHTPVRGIRFRGPGALHQARWLAKVLYAIKI